jgi:hypothetical protein
MLLLKMPLKVFREEILKAKGTVVGVYRTISEMDAQALEALAVLFRNF